MSIGPRRIPKKGENYQNNENLIKQEDGIFDYLPWLFVFRGWF